MSQKLYEEALADARKVTEIAEGNAKQAVLNAVLPRIKQLIENNLLDDVYEQEVSDDLLTDELADDLGLEDQIVPPSVGLVDVAGENPVAPADAISLPDEEGKVTLDLDALAPIDDSGVVPKPMFNNFSKENEEYELSLESLGSLKVLKSAMFQNHSHFMLEYKKLVEGVKKFNKASKLVRESSGYNDQISRMISRVENMYEYLQESISDSSTKEKLNTNLEIIFQNLNKLQETATAMSTKTRKTRLNEEEELQVDDLDLGDAADDSADEDGSGSEELTLKLTGLPDDVDLDDIGVDLIVDDGADADADVDVDVDADLDGLDLGDEADADVQADDDDVQLEGLSDDTVVEIDESMLRREIARMTLNEDKLPADELNANGHGSASGLDDFGGADAVGDPLVDVDVCTDGAEPLGEGDELDDELDVQNEDHSEELPMESVKRRLKFEKRLQERAKQVARMLNLEAKRPGISSKKLQSLKAQYRANAKTFNESKERSSKILKQINESAKGVGSNSVTRSAADKAVKQLRARLEESNLSNVKLVYANKLLQMNLSNSVKSYAVKKLDECKSPREAKLVYESVVSKTQQRSAPLKESVVRSASSNPTRSGSAQVINEGFVESSRWQKLAGITK